jgi:hypothetical protein
VLDRCVCLHLILLTSICQVGAIDHQGNLKLTSGSQQISCGLILTPYQIIGECHAIHYSLLHATICVIIFIKVFISHWCIIYSLPSIYCLASLNYEPHFLAEIMNLCMFCSIIIFLLQNKYVRK